jgi:hypothetical protein
MAASTPKVTKQTTSDNTSGDNRVKAIVDQVRNAESDSEVLMKVGKDLLVALRTECVANSTSENIPPCDENKCVLGGACATEARVQRICAELQKSILTWNHGDNVRAMLRQIATGSSAEHTEPSVPVVGRPFRAPLR